jgi:predicted HicB family RNase H-like nuclease
MMQYKGYLGNVIFDAENDIFHGEVVGIRDVVTFQGKSVAELRKALRDSVDDYLDFCRQRGQSPDKPLSGRFVLRISRNLHRKVYELASRAGQSLNAWVASRLESAVEHPMPAIASARQSRLAEGTKRRGRTKTKRR